MISGESITGELMRSKLAVVTVAVVVVVLFGTTSDVLAAGTRSEAQAPALTGHVTVDRSTTPAFNGDAPDPDVVLSGGTYYAFTTGTPLGNHLQALVDTSGSPASGWRSYTGLPYGSTALPSPPGWETPNTQTSPGVFNFGGHWVMFYDASTNPHPADSGYSCLSVAVAVSLSPTHPVFTDTSAGPLHCAAGGVLDPSPFVDPRTGDPYLLFKSNDGSSAEASQVWSVRLSSNGTAFAGTPKVLLTVDTAQLPWETTFDDPQLIYDAGTYRLLFSAGNWESSSYDEALTVCSGPSGPCSQPSSGPFLTSYGPVSGPGGGSLFTDTSGRWWIDYAAWSSSCTNYSCGGERRLFVAPITLTSSIEVPCKPPSGHPSGYRLVATDGGIFSFGNLPFCGSTGSITLNRPVVGIASTPDGGGYWMVASDGGIFAFGNAGFHGSMGGRPLNRPIVGMATTPNGGGYWLVASDGGIFSFGNAKYHGSTGHMHLHKPIVGMAATPDGNGYWLVASDGGIFSFGDAKFRGSAGHLHLNRPVVGMATDTKTGGYWLVASDGGIFSYDAPFLGSMGNRPLNRPIVGIQAPVGGTGYRMVASDGGIFSFKAPYFGSMGGRPLNKPVVGISGF